MEALVLHTIDRRRDDYAVKSGAAVVELIRKGITTRQILTKKAFENAITVLMALGGSTNAVLHLLAIAYEAEVDLTLEDFHRVGSKVPFSNFRSSLVIVDGRPSTRAMPSPATTTVPISSRDALPGSYDLTKFAKASRISSGRIVNSAMIFSLPILRALCPRRPND